MTWRAWGLGRGVGLLALATLAGACGPTSEHASLNFFVDAQGALVGLDAGTSASGAEVELAWTIELTNLDAGAACPVAVYRWIAEPVPLDVVLPAIADPALESWPEQLEGGGELVETGVVEPGARSILGPELLSEPAQLVVGELGIAACPDADLRAVVDVEATADLGARSLSDSFGLRVLRIR